MWIGKYTTELLVFAGLTINVPSLFIGGKGDWGVYQNPGALEKNAKDSVHTFTGNTSGGWGRALGAARAAGGSKRAACKYPNGAT
jgi:hypothetical protein